jgi:hypothetical protein
MFDFELNSYISIANIKDDCILVENVPFWDRLFSTSFSSLSNNYRFLFHHASV